MTGGDGAIGRLLREFGTRRSRILGLRSRRGPDLRERSTSTSRFLGLRSRNNLPIYIVVTIIVVAIIVTTI